jgi:sterol desaturase/sphingolipid hydroxylase (fatty acid hydroxylase superfamily)
MPYARFPGRFPNKAGRMRQHHRNDSSHYNRNFAPHLVVFDLLFGTGYIPPSGVMPDDYGVPDAVPESFVQQMLSPFRRTGHAAEPPVPAE